MKALLRLLAWLGIGREPTGGARTADAQAAPAAKVEGVKAPSAADLVAEFEGFRAVPYLCPAGVPTIGFGTTVYPDGRKVQLSDPPCTRETARQWLEHDLAGARAALKLYVKVPLTEGMRAGLLSFIYNVGSASFARSTLLRLLNRGDVAGAREQFQHWVHAGDKVLPGLVTRRAREAEVFSA